MVIHVFLNDKLISADIIVPLLYEIKNQKKNDANIKVHFYFASYEGNGLESLKRNIVLYDSMCNLGKYTVYGRKTFSRFSKFFHRLWLIKFMFFNSISIIFRESYIFHFGAIDKYPLKFFYLINKSRSYFFSQWPFAYPQNLFIVNHHYKKRKLNTKPVSASKYITYTKDKNNPDLYRFKNITNIRIDCNPHKGSSWHKYLESNGQQWLNLYNLEFKSNHYITFALRHFNHEAGLINPNTDLSDLLFETLKVIDTTLSNQTLLLKPHSFTDINHLKGIVKKFNNNNYIIVELHPLILSYISKVFISNFFSILYNDAHIFNTPVIEFTRYSDETLDLIDHGPIYPEGVTHFINNDSNKFAKILKSINDAEYSEHDFMAKENLDVINVNKLFIKDKG
jgi:hypothetical protein